MASAVECQNIVRPGVAALHLRYHNDKLLPADRDASAPISMPLAPRWRLLTSMPSTSEAAHRSNRNVFRLARVFASSRVFGIPMNSMSDHRLSKPKKSEYPAGNSRSCSTGDHRDHPLQAPEAVTQSRGKAIRTERPAPRPSASRPQKTKKILAPDLAPRNRGRYENVRKFNGKSIRKGSRALTKSGLSTVT